MPLFSRALLGIGLTALVAAAAAGQADPRALYQSGKYQQALEAAGDLGAADPATVYYVGAPSLKKLGDAAQANALYEQLASRGEDDPWHHVGRSALLLAQGNPDEALAAVNRALEIAPGLAYAQYQKGLVLGEKQDFAAAAAAFDAAAKADPSLAYASYYAGLSYYRAKRIDLMATNFERFLKQAPEAPERPEVESIMRTVRGH